MSMSKVQQFNVPNGSASFFVQVNEDGSWIAYPSLNGQPDYANGIEKISLIPKKIRDAVRLYVDKCRYDFAADKIS
jgi:hypothetical protein